MDTSSIIPTTPRGLSGVNAPDQDSRWRDPGDASAPLRPGLEFGVAQQAAAGEAIRPGRDRAMSAHDGGTPAA